MTDRREVAQPSPLLVFPCNGNGLEAIDCLGDAYRFLGFVDDTPEKLGMTEHGHAVFDRSALAQHADARVLAVPGSPTSFRVRQRIVDALALPPERFATVIHPLARVSPLARIGHNVLIMAGAVVTSNAVIGNHVCVLPNTVIHHDVVIGDWTLIGSNVTLAGSVQIGESCYIGSGTQVMNNRRVGPRVLIGLGSNVIRDVDAGCTVAGNPARVLRRD